MNKKIQIPFYGLDKYYKKNENKIVSIISDSMRSGQFIDGNYTKMLEETLSNVFNRKNAVTTGSGTDALFFALQALQIGKNDEVLVPAISFIASATAITRTGAVPIFVDVDTSTALMDLADAQQKITSKTKAILFVDLYGNMPDPNALEAFAARNNLILIEDAAQGIGSEINGCKAGSIGDISIFSFDPSKPIGAFGTGGAVLTNDSKIARLCIAYRQNGKNPDTGKYEYFGINSRISEQQAVLISWQMLNFDKILSKRIECAREYLNRLESLPFKILVKSQFSYKGNFHKFVIASQERDLLRNYLYQNGIETKLHYSECLYKHPILNGYYHFCPNAEKIATMVLSLPMHPELQNQEIDYICNTIKHFYL